MRVIVVGATGNVGTALIRALMATAQVDSLVGVSRRSVSADVKAETADRCEWVAADIATDRLEPLFDGADCVVHMAWLFQPTHHPEVTWSNNVGGAERVFEAARSAGVSKVVSLSSIAAYSPRDSDEPTDETWPTHGASLAAYAAQKAYQERLLDALERNAPQCQVVRMRPAFIFQRATATQQRRLFAGPLVPGRLIRPSTVPVLPFPRGLTFQAIHADDVASAITSSLLRSVSGAFNLAAEPVLDKDSTAALLDARPVELPVALVRAALAAAWRSHLVPADPWLFDALMRLPTLSTERARSELDWRPAVTAEEALGEFLVGVREGATGTTPPLSGEAGGPGRVSEFATGVGERADAATDL